MSEVRNGAQALLEAARAAGAEICFANPGTTELTLVHALQRVPSIRPVLGLFEGCVRARRMDIRACRDGWR